MSVKSIQGLNVFKRTIFKKNEQSQYTCGDKKVFKAAPIREMNVDSFELQCCGKKR